ncbi:MAG TPA: recombination protein NinB [Urbifossiella sp.]|nr:recombination protein NinB [Urbifossiella sp.]
MTAALEFVAPVVDGRLPERDARRIGEAIRKLGGKRVAITVAEVKKTRSGQQNRYYWGMVVKLVTDAFRDGGNMVNAEDVHDFLKTHVGKLTQVLVTADGEVFRAPGSTTKLTTAEFSDYVEAVRAWAKEVLDLDIPTPDESSTTT